MVCLSYKKECFEYQLIYNKIKFGESYLKKKTQPNA